MRYSRKYRWWLFKENILQCYLRWKRRDRRKKGWGEYKWAINRDGDLFLVECPKCHSQKVWFDKKRRCFSCRKCDIIFTVYMEDGIVEIRDHRKGNAGFPASVVFDEACKLHRLGIKNDAPWWWSKRQIQRDLRNGKDAHGHAEYKIIGSHREYHSPVEATSNESEQK